MEIIGWIAVGAILFYMANRHDKKMNENFMNMLIKHENLEERVQTLEYYNQDKDKTIEHLQERVRDLEDRVFELEKPHQRSILDDLD